MTYDHSNLFFDVFINCAKSKHRHFRFSNAEPISGQHLFPTMSLFSSARLILIIITCLTQHSCCPIVEIYFPAIQILLSNDCHPNPGPIYKFPCGVCRKTCKANHNCIACDSCDAWFHIKCMNMPLEVFQGTNNTSWICCNCGLPNFSTTLFETFVADSITTQNSYSHLSDEGCTTN